MALIVNSDSTLKDTMISKFKNSVGRVQCHLKFLKSAGNCVEPPNNQALFITSKPDLNPRSNQEPALGQASTSEL